MFLKDLLRKYLYKPLCEYCGSPLRGSKVFCVQCQSDFYYEFSQNRTIVMMEDGGYTLLVDKMPYFKLLIRRAQNSRNLFLLDGIASIVIVLIHALDLPWPRKLIETSFIEDQRVNRLFFKKLSKLINRPLETESSPRKGLFLSI